MKIIKFFIFLFFVSTQAFAACQTGYFPTSESNTTRKYINCNNESEIPGSGMTSGDLIFADDTAKFYVANSSTTYFTTGVKPTGDDQLRVSTSSLASTWVSLPSTGVDGCSGSSSDKILYRASDNTFLCGSDQGGAGSSAGMIMVSEDSAAFTSIDTINFTTGVKATFSGTKATVSGDMATTTTPGIASFDTTYFTVGPFGGVSHKTLPVNTGGTGITTSPGNGFLLIGNAGSYSSAALTSGNNTTITNTGGTITIGTTTAYGLASNGVAYITQIPDGNLTAEQSLSSLSTGYIKNTTGTGVLTSQAVPIPVADGGTAVTTSPNHGAILIGTGGGYSSAQIASGGNVTIYSSSGTVTVAANTGGNTNLLQYNNNSAFGGTTGISYDSSLTALRTAATASIDFSAIDNSATAGLVIPTTAGAITNVSRDGQIIWSRSEDVIYVGNGSKTTKIGSQVLGFADSATKTSTFSCSLFGGCVIETTSMENLSRLPMSGLIKNLKCNIGTAPGASTEWSARMMVNNVSANTQCVIAGASATSCQDNVSTSAVIANETVGIQISKIGAAAGTTATACTIEFIPTGGT